MHPSPSASSALSASSARSAPPARTLTVVTVALLALTIVSAWLAESGQRLPVALGVVALGFAWIKGWLVAEHYMELRRAPWLLRLLALGWLSAVCGGLILAFL